MAAPTCSMTQAMAGRQERRGRQRAALVGLATGVVTRAAADHSLEELDGLARAAGADVVLRLVQERPAPDPALYLGRGKVGDADERRAPSWTSIWSSSTTS